MAGRTTLFSKNNQIGPFLKWAGGKSQLLGQFINFLPPTLEGRDYVEPFMGSASVFFYVKQNLNPKSCTLLDVNPELVNAFIQIRDNTEQLIESLSDHKNHHNRPNIKEEERKEYYYNIRNVDPEPFSVAGAARFIYLNKTCFNGLHRLNSKGKFNVPMGSYKSPSIFDSNHLRMVSRLLKDTTIEICPFQDCESFITENSFVYFDPPYEPLSRTSSFTSYAKDDFTQENQEELRDLLVRISPRCNFMLSNSTAELIEELYSSTIFHKHYVSASRSINSIAEGRGKIRELLITNYMSKKDHINASLNQLSLETL